MNDVLENTKDSKNQNTIKIICIALVFVLIIASRFAYLSEKPYHHDESQYALFSYYVSNGAQYKYDPILHGPFLFYINTILYHIFGDNNYSARAGCAFFGVLVALILLFLSRWIGFWASFTLIILYAISPTFTYYNRFLFHDTYVAFFSILFIFYFISHIKTLKSKFIYLSSLALSFLFLIKVNSYIYSFIFFTFLLLLYFIKLPGDGEQKKKEYCSKLKFQSMHILLGVILFFFVFFVFYSSFFTYIQGFFDGLFIKSLGYWIGQHSVQRIEGDFDYYLPIIAVYELPAVIVVALAFIKKLFRNKKSSQLTIAVFVINLAVLIGVQQFWKQGTPEQSKVITEFFDKIFHMQYPYQISLLLLLIYSGIFVTYSYIKEGRLILAFSSYWFFLSILIYSYAGEKVPWLSLNIIMPMFFCCALILDKFLESPLLKTRLIPRFAFIIAIALSVGFTVAINYRVSIKYPADPKERIVFVQTSTQMTPVVKIIKNIAEKTREGKDLKISIHGEAGWPLNWYFRHYKTTFPPPPINNRDNKVIVLDYDKANRSEHLKKRFDYQHVKLREWWVPDKSKKPGLKEFLNYYLKREVWNDLGSTDIGFYTRKANN